MEEVNRSSLFSTCSFSQSTISRLIHTGIRPNQSAINQGLSESNPAADIQQIKPGKVRTPNSLGQPLEERLPRVFHAMSHDVGRIALQRVGN